VSDRPISGHSVLAKEICDVLGLKHVKKLDLHFDVNSAVTADVVFYPEKDGIKQTITIMRRYTFSIVDESEPS
jgi:hypothetical protein